MIVASTIPPCPGGGGGGGRGRGRASLVTVRMSATDRLAGPLLLSLVNQRIAGGLQICASFWLYGSQTCFHFTWHERKMPLTHENGGRC